MRRAAIIIPTHVENPSPLDLISISQGIRIFEGYSIYLLCPSVMSAQIYKQRFPSLIIKQIPSYWMSSPQSYSRLMTSTYFYELFQNYEFTFIYQMDAFVFRNEIPRWIESGFDFVGAPWFEGFSKPKSEKLIGVGNSGFCLRRTSAFLNVLNALPSFETQSISNLQVFSEILPYLGLDWRDRLSKFGSEPCLGPEDVYWGMVIPLVFPGFKVAPPEKALAFSFEVNPRKLYEMNHNQLPFGCHAWPLYDLEFWMPFIENEGFTIPSQSFQNEKEPKLCRM